MRNYYRHAHSCCRHLSYIRIDELNKNDHHEHFTVLYGKIVRPRINCNILIEYPKFRKYHLVFWHISAFFFYFPAISNTTIKTEVANSQETGTTLFTSCY